MYFVINNSKVSTLNSYLLTPNSYLLTPIYIKLYLLCDSGAEEVKQDIVRNEDSDGGEGCSAIAAREKTHKEERDDHEH